MAQQFKLVMAQLNLLVGDIDANADRVIAAAQEAKNQHGAQMVVFPELTLTGYPPEDLLFRPSLKLRVDRALQRILAANLDIYLVLGFPERKEDGLYNALGVIKGDQLVAVYHKQRLPSYEVFDEHRYFKPGHEACVVEIAGSRMAFTVCEDMWETQPVSQARAAGAQLMININASPYHLNKLRDRQALLQQRSGEGGFPIVYVNLVGGQDELVFDGGSMAVNASGECCRLAPSYAEGLYPLTIDIAADGGCALPVQEIAPAQALEAQVYQALVLGVRDYVNKNGFPGVVLGLSGGIDSALTLAVAVDALGSDRVHAVMMPFEYTSQLSLDAAAEQAEGLASITSDRHQRCRWRVPQGAGVRVRRH
ncbi:MAG: nitrilase-related carbon-nitrogen hydrolase [Pseudohongiellaceae bacterium]